MAAKPREATLLHGIHALRGAARLAAAHLRVVRQQMSIGLLDGGARRQRRRGALPLHASQCGTRGRHLDAQQWSSNACEDGLDTEGPWTKIATDK